MLKKVQNEVVPAVLKHSVGDAEAAYLQNVSVSVLAIMQDRDTALAGDITHYFAEFDVVDTGDMASKITDFVGEIRCARQHQLPITDYLTSAKWNDIFPWMCDLLIDASCDLAAATEAATAAATEAAKGSAILAIAALPPGTRAMYEGNTAEAEQHRAELVEKYTKTLMEEDTHFRPNQLSLFPQSNRLNPIYIVIGLASFRECSVASIRAMRVRLKRASS